MEKLKAEILSRIPVYTPESYEWHGLEEFEALIYEQDGHRIYGDAIQAALDKYHCVEIPKGKCLYLRRPIIMRSGYRLKLA